MVRDIGDRIISGSVGLVIGAGVLFLGAQLLRGCVSDTIRQYKEDFSDSKSLQTLSEDLNENGLPERYIELEGKRYFLEIDNKPVQEYIQR